jgi:hypothetical protein
LDEHWVRPIAHGAWHDPFEQASPASQACAHDPQFFGSFAKSKHTLPQGDWPLGHVGGGGGTQSPELQVFPTGQSESLEHACWRPPQLAITSATTVRTRTYGLIGRGSTFHSARFAQKVITAT